MTEKTINEIIDDWFCTHFHNSAASRNTEIYNQILAACLDLKFQLGDASAAEYKQSTTTEDLNHGTE